ncbi:transmembrane protein 258 [Phtheirospermum japonicum]|uniref:Transmembrane protein 258 n=1 Tax=Phtheirospermum japonicum TaxID=374723 RepID=A0A830C2F3_9LAMI|nr:transmembrane protein 258 [Phtheirospermum japonicum]
MVREMQAEQVVEALEMGEIKSGSGLNQELGLKRPDDTPVNDLQLGELNNRFDKVNTELLICMACLNPRDGFSSFDKKKVLQLATLYPSEFSSVGLMALECQLDIFIENMRKDVKFRDLNDLGSLSMMLVEIKKHVTYPAIYLIIKLMLILPVTTASVERVFSGMTYVKNRLRNSMGDQLLNNCLVTFVEKDMFLQIPDDDVINRFQKMKTADSIAPSVKPISSPVPEAWYPTLSVLMLAIGLIITASFFIYEATSSRKNRSLAKELSTGAVASVFLGFGSLFLLLSSGIYV